jgi:hypothetical protein
LQKPFGQEQPKRWRQSFKPGRQHVQPSNKVSQRLHPPGPRRPKLVLMQVAVIAAADGAQLRNDVID